MKILAVSEFSYKSNINFAAQKDEKPKSEAVVTNSIKKAVPTAAVILAMMADPVASQKAEASDLVNENTETQWVPPFVAPVPPYYYPYVQPYYYPYNYNPYNFFVPSVIMMNYLQSMAALNNVYSKPVSPVAVGNVTFNKNDVAAVNAYSYDDVQYHSVVLNNGTNVVFPMQDEDNYAVVYKDDKGYTFEGLSNAYILGSKNRDRFTLNGCQNTIVDVGSDNKIDRVVVQKYRITPANVRQYTENVTVTASEGDVVNNRIVQYDEETMTFSGH